MRWRLATLLCLGPVAVLAQDWSGASLRAAPTLHLPPGYRVDVLGRGFQLPQDLALDPPDGLWVLTQADRAGGAGALVRLPLAEVGPVEAAALPSISIPFASTVTRFRVGSMARHPATGEIYVAEQSGRHIFRVSPAGRVVLYAAGLNLLADTRALAFDEDGRLVVLDFAGRSPVADVATGHLRELFGDADRYVGPVVYRLRVDDPLPLPRNLEYAVPVFPPRALRLRGAQLARYGGVLALPSGALAISTSGGAIDRLHRDGTITPVARVAPSGRAVGTDRAGHLYAVDYLGGRLVRVTAEGAVHRFVEGLVRPAAVLVEEDGTVLVADDTSRVLRLRPPG